MSDTISTDYLVTGMTCAHCVASITEEVGAINSVDAVSVELVNGGASVVTVTSATPVSDEQIRAAVTEAGYTLVSS
jgi:copper chaperone CopZ